MVRGVRHDVRVYDGQIRSVVRDYGHGAAREGSDDRREDEAVVMADDAGDGEGADDELGFGPVGWEGGEVGEGARGEVLAEGGGNFLPSCGGC